jgi:tetratricopeptide (TPR) repeat protein
MPELGRCIIVLGNTSATATGAIELGITGILDDGEPWPATRRGDYAVAAAVLDEGPEAAAELLAGLPQVVQDEYIERDVNGIGYQLMQVGALDEALAVFEFLTTAYPESANTWDSLGEARRAVGDHERAIECYRKALELDPEYPTALAALEQLGALEPAE